MFNYNQRLHAVEGSGSGSLRLEPANDPKTTYNTARKESEKRLARNEMQCYDTVIPYIAPLIGVRE